MKLYTISHKHLELEIDSIRQPLYVGAYQCDINNRNNSWEYDDTGRHNISSKNSTFCELTGLFHIWKTATDSIIGIEHYRRYLKSETGKEPISEAEISAILETYDAIVASPVPCVNSFDGKQTTVEEQFSTFHSLHDLCIVRDILSKMPDKRYITAFKNLMCESSFYPYNIIVCNRVQFNAYAKWLFTVIDACERRIDLFHGRSEYQGRIFGFLAERLLNVWIIANNLKVKALPVFDPAEPSKEMNISYENISERITVHHDLHGWNPTYESLDFSSIFSYDEYLTRNNDLVDTYSEEGQASFEHYLNYGLKEGRIAHPTFNLRSYMNTHPDLRKLFQDDVIRYCLEYVTTSRKDKAYDYLNTVLGYCPHPYEYVYDYAYYYDKYKDDLPEEAKYDTELTFKHFLSVGIREGRQASILFNPIEHLTDNERNAPETINWKNVFSRNLKRIPFFRKTCLGKRTRNIPPKNDI